MDIKDAPFLVMLPYFFSCVILQCGGLLSDYLIFQVCSLLVLRWIKKFMKTFF